MFIAFLMFLPDIAQALTGHWDLSSQRDLNYSLVAESTDILVSENFKFSMGNPDNLSQKTFSLSQNKEVLEKLIGQLNISAQQILAILAPQLDNCHLHLFKIEASKDDSLRHEWYQLHCGGFLVHGSELSLHFRNNFLIMLRSSLPSFSLPNPMISNEDFLPLSSLDLSEDILKKNLFTERGITEFNSRAVPSWLIVYHDEETSQTRRILFNAFSGSVISADTMSFDFSHPTVSESEADEKNESLAESSPSDLEPTGFLDGRHFQIFAPDLANPRATAPFKYSPDIMEESLFFDQVKIYEIAMHTLTWIQQNLGYATEKATKVPIRINSIIGGSGENAQYLPAPKGPEILIGKGGERLINLARDRDVFTHEFMHHIIFEYLPSYNGDAGIIHEGSADYFTYAINGDPYLAEESSVSKIPLRSAILPYSIRFDTLSIYEKPHVRGQIWSALLWDLRSVIGPSFDQIVFQSFSFLGPKSGIRDAILALTLALGPSDKEKICLIYELAAKRGFGFFLDGFDTKACPLDIGSMVSESKSLYAANLHSHRTSDPPWENKMLDKFCGVIEAPINQSKNQSIILSFLFFLAWIPRIYQWIWKKS